MTEGVRKPADHLYWARTQSTLTPVKNKPLDRDAAEALEQAAAAKRGAAWNAASTWEEKDISKWARELLSETLLPSVAAAFELSPSESAKLPAEFHGSTGCGCSLKVASVASTTGDVTHVLSRGKQRVVFELGIKLFLELEVWQGSELKHILTGTLNITEVRPCP
jgi:activator of HSP90 ATPase